MSEQPAEAVTATETTTTEVSTEPVQPKPSETVDYWKQRARQNETQAKANADAARRLAEIEESSKSEQQKAADRAAAAERAAQDSKAETLRYRAAAKYRIDEDAFDLIGTGSEDEIDERAKRVGDLLTAARAHDELKAENERLKVENEALRTGKPIPGTGRTVEQLMPGATPSPDPEFVQDAYPASWMPRKAGTRSG